MKILETAEMIGNHLKTFLPGKWDGKDCILKMKDAGARNWKQTEWIGWYFQYLCEKHLPTISMKIPGPKYGRPQFDGLLEIPWDFKAHAMNTSKHSIIVNDSEAIAKGIKQYGAIGLILALGEVEYNDEKRTFQQWHNELKGGKSKYELDKISRGAWSRLRKVSLNLQQISIIRINDDTLVKCGTFQEGFRNSNGAPRRPKVLIDLEKIDEEILHIVEF